MKAMKKIAVFVLAMMLVIPCFSMVSKAATGQIQFTDPETKTGDNFEVTCAVKSDNGIALEDVSVTITYDTEMIKFVEGNGVSEDTAGTLQYSGTGTEAALRFNMKFQALKEGTTQIKVSNYSAYLNTDDKVECQQGYATVTIAKGSEVTTTEPVAGTTTVTVNEVSYTLAASIPADALPEGFKETTLPYEGEDKTFVKNDESGIYLAYLLNEEGKGKFFMYDTEHASFSPFEQIQISKTTTIVLLSDASAVKMPEEYSQITLTVNDYDYPAWQSSENIVNYVLYALNNSGEASLYQFDSEEGTYQRFETPEVIEAEVDDSLSGRLKESDSFNYYLVLDIIVLAVLLVLVIVLGVKLHNRNLELDDLYDEYGIDLEDAVVEEKEVAKTARKDMYEDDGINVDELEYEEDSFDVDFEQKLAQQTEEEEPEVEEEIPNVVKEEDSDFEDFDFDLIDLDDLND